MSILPYGGSHGLAPFLTFGANDLPGTNVSVHVSVEAQLGGKGETAASVRGVEVGLHVVQRLLFGGALGIAHGARLVDGGHLVIPLLVVVGFQMPLQLTKITKPTVAKLAFDRPFPLHLICGIFFGHIFPSVVPMVTQVP